jgi:hypothetical protein
MTADLRLLSASREVLATPEDIRNGISREWQRYLELADDARTESADRALQHLDHEGDH